MAKSSHRKGHGTGVKDYQTLAELAKLPPRESLVAPGHDERQYLTFGTIHGTYSQEIDPRTDVEKAAQDAWDKRYDEIMAGHEKRRSDQKTEQIQRAIELAVGEKPTLASTPEPEKKGDDVAENEKKETNAAGPGGGSGERSGKGEDEKKKKPSEQTPIQPRNVSVTSDDRNYGSRNPQTYLDGLPDRGDAVNEAKVKQAFRNKAATVVAQSDTERKDAEQAARDADRQRSAQAGRKLRVEGDESNEYWRKRNDKLQSERAERNYAKRVANTASDWENLGRLRGNDELDGGPALDDKAYNERVAGLLARAKKLRTAEGRAGLSDPELREMNGFFKTVGKVTVDEAGNVSHANGKRFTNAQIDALTKKIDRYENLAGERQGRMAAMTKMLDAERVSKLRQQYGLTDPNVFSREDVLRFHEGETGRRVKDALQKMRDSDPKNYKEYSDNWVALGKSGADLEGAFNKALSNPATKSWYMGQIAGKSAEERDTIRRGVILDQLYGEHGINLGGSLDPVSGAYTPRKTLSQAHSVPDDETAAMRDFERTEGGERGPQTPAPQPAPQQPAPLAPKQSAVPAADVLQPQSEHVKNFLEDQQKKLNRPIMLYAGGRTPLEPRRRR